ncbi:MAG: hypothetical protein JJT76_02160 [Clostridiaceae bacterium]|nr:hypothetical protein [Clostridiaceae bacterium]
MESNEENVLKQIQDDILNKGPIFFIVAAIIALSFIITVKEIQLILEITRFLLCSICAIIMVLIGTRYKETRTKKENKTILSYTIFFLVLNVVIAYNVINHMN